MLVTVVTLYVGRSIEHYVGVVTGRMSNEQRQSLASHYHATLDEDPDGEDEEARVLFFAEVNAVEDPTKLTTLFNLDGDTDHEDA